MVAGSNTGDESSKHERLELVLKAINGMRVASGDEMAFEKEVQENEMSTHPSIEFLEGDMEI